VRGRHHSRWRDLQVRVELLLNAQLLDHSQRYPLSVLPRSVRSLMRRTYGLISTNLLLFKIIKTDIKLKMIRISGGYSNTNASRVGFFCINRLFSPIDFLAPNLFFATNHFLVQKKLDRRQPNHLQLHTSFTTKFINIQLIGHVYPRTFGWPHIEIDIKRNRF
jgi:hypothetical protein